MLHDIFFYTLGILGILSGIGLVTNRNPIYCVLFIIINFFCIGGLFLILQAEFLAAIQIIVYAGAIMVLFLFVIMLLNISVEERGDFRFDWRKGAAFILGLGFLAEMLFAFGGVRNLENPQALAQADFSYGKVEPIGRELMTNYLFPFEMISVILLAALIGAIVIAKRYR